MSTDVRAIIAGAIDDRYGVMFAEDVLAALDARGIEVLLLPPVTISADDPDYFTVFLADGSYYVGMNMEPHQLRERAAAYLAIARHLDSRAVKDGA